MSDGDKARRGGSSLSTVALAVCPRCVQPFLVPWLHCCNAAVAASAEVAASSALAANLPATRARSSGCMVAILIVVMATHFYFFHLYPPESLVTFVQTVTATRLPELVAEDAATAMLNYPSTSPVVKQPPSGRSRTKPDNGRRGNAVADASTSSSALENEGDARGGTGSAVRPFHPDEASSEEVDVLASQPTSKSPRQQQRAATSHARNLTLARRRISAKHHVICPTQIFFEYPIAYLLCVSWGLALQPWMSPNLVSFTHPLFGLLAGVLIARAAIVVRAPDRGVAGPADGLDEVGGGEGLPPTSIGDEELGSLVSGRAVASGVTTPHRFTQVALPHSLPHRQATAGPPPVNVGLLRLGAVCFTIRSILDTMDGVIARTQNAHRIALPTTFGYSGHMIDATTDTLGCMLGGSGVLVFLWQTANDYAAAATSASVPPPVPGPMSPSSSSQSPSAAVGVGIFSWKLSPRTIVAVGLSYGAVCVAIWEKYMLQYANLFDVHVWYHPELVPTDSSIHVRINQWLWSLFSGDAFFLFITYGLLTNKLFEVTRGFCVIGYPGLVLVTLHSVAVWTWVVGANPVAAALMAAPSA